MNTTPSEVRLVTKLMCVCGELRVVVSAARPFGASVSSDPHASETAARNQALERLELLSA